MKGMFFHWNGTHHCYTGLGYNRVKFFDSYLFLLLIAGKPYPLSSEKGKPPEVEMK
jgi:hypothetical protein